MVVMTCMKQMEYGGSEVGEKKEGDGVDATSEYCAKAIGDHENRSSEQTQGALKEDRRDRRRKAMTMI